MSMKQNGVNQQKKQEKEWLKGYRWKPGQSGNPKGRPKGKTLKEWAAGFLMELPDDKKLAFLKDLSAEIVWRMAEGNPAQSTDITTLGKELPQPIFAGLSVQDDTKHDSHEKDIPAEEKN